ncbi:MAG: NAD-dependent epimerase/dehydratase family protein [Bacteroidetes bacterium]|nr:NAD-dependent epimerase/dehydratase family protein [Bacteroidota bacterium]
MDERAFENIDTVVHLAGAGIADEKWTAARKKEIIDSRVISSKLLASEINKRGNQIKTFVGASAVGFYGAITNEKVYTETDAACDDFMGNTCKQWEESYNEINKNIRLNIIRIGVVLSKDGGALPKISKTIKMGIGSALGSGKQYMPWIHIDDLVGLFYEAITNEKMHGIYNGVARSTLLTKNYRKQ